MRTLSIRLPQTYHFAIRQAVANFDFRGYGEVVRIAIMDTIAKQRNLKLKHHMVFDSPCNMVVSCKIPDEIHAKITNSYCKPHNLTLSECVVFLVIEWLKLLNKEDRQRQKAPFYVQWRQNVGPSLRTVYTI